MPTLGIINKQYVSAVDSMLDTRDIKHGAVDLYREDRLTDIMQLAGRYVPVTQPIYFDWANESLHKQIDTTGVTFTNNSTNTITINGLATGSSGYNRVNDIIQYQGTGNPTFLITSVSTSGGQDTLIVKAIDGASKTLTAGTKFNHLSHTAGARADRQTNLKYGFTKFSNKVMIFSEVSEIDDIQKMSTIEVTVNGQPSYLVKDHLDKTIKMKGDINAQLWGGEMSGTNFNDASPFLVDNMSVTGGGGGGAIQSTRGVNSYISTFGVTGAVTTAGTIALADLDTFNANLLAARASDDYWCVSGKTAKGAVDKLWKNLNSSGVTSARLEVSGQDVNTTVDKVSYGGFNYNYQAMKILDHPAKFAGTDIAKSMYFLPYNDGVEIYGGGMEPAMTIRYYAQPSNFTYSGGSGSMGNGLVGEIQSGAFNTVNPTGTDRMMRTEWVTYQGLQLLGASFSGRLKVL